MILTPAELARAQDASSLCRSHPICAARRIGSCLSFPMSGHSDSTPFLCQPRAVSPSPVSEPTARECRCGLWPGQWGCGCSWAAEPCQARGAVSLGQGAAGTEHMGGEGCCEKITGGGQVLLLPQPGPGYTQAQPPPPSPSAVQDARALWGFHPSLQAGNCSAWPSLGSRTLKIQH